MGLFAFGRVPARCRFPKGKMETFAKVSDSLPAPFQAALLRGKGSLKPPPVRLPFHNPIAPPRSAERQIHPVCPPRAVRLFRQTEAVGPHVHVLHAERSRQLAHIGRHVFRQQHQRRAVSRSQTQPETRPVQKQAARSRHAVCRALRPCSRFRLLLPLPPQIPAVPRQSSAVFRADNAPSVPSSFPPFRQPEKAAII